MHTLNTDKSWKGYGKNNPYYGVLAHDKFLDKHLTEAVKKEFFESGDIFIGKIFETLNKEFKNNFHPKRALDFGCGTGRLALPIAKRADYVTGVDISAEMLKEATLNSQKQKLENISFKNSAEFIQNLKEKQFDFIHSYIVFQHINLERGEKIFKKLYNSLEIGGIGVIQLTYNNTKSKSERVINLFRYRIPYFNNFLNLIRGKPFRLPLMQMNLYDLNKILFFLQQSGVGKTLLQFTDHGGHQGVVILFQREETTINT